MTEVRKDLGTYVQCMSQTYEHLDVTSQSVMFVEGYFAELSVGLNGGLHRFGTCRP